MLKAEGVRLKKNKIKLSLGNFSLKPDRTSA